MLRGQRPWRELHWLSLMPNTRVTAVGESRPAEPVDFVARAYRQPVRRFVEAGALAWLRGLSTVPGNPDWVASLELCSLVTGQVSRVARRTRARQAVLVWANDARSPLYRVPPYHQALERSKDADLFLCFVEAARQHCVELGLPADRCRVVLPGVDTGLFSPAPVPTIEPIVCFVSPLATNKGLDRVLDAFALARRTVPDARLRIAGSGPLERLVQQVAATPGSGVELVGALDRPGVAQLLRTSAVFTTAPRPTRVWNEQFGLAYVEAMSSGLPVVTTICGSNHEAVQPPNVRVEDDAEALAEALVGFLVDPALRARVGAHNRAHVLEHHELHRQCALMGEAFSAAERSSVRTVR